MIRRGASRFCPGRTGRFMINLCPQQGCAACYDLSADDVGRTFRCLHCDALLEVEERGLKLLASPGEEAPRDPLPARSRQPSRPENVRMPSIVREANGVGGVLNLLGTAIFTFGALLVILFL